VRATPVARWDDLRPDEPAYALVENVDLVVIRRPEDTVVVMYGRCQHRGALLSDGAVRRGRLTCALHGSTYEADTGKNIHYPGADLHTFEAWVDQGQVWTDADAWTFCGPPSLQSPRTVNVVVPFVVPGRDSSCVLDWSGA
jgi:methylamine---glutamate N-methyltransferase subunit C